MIDSHVHVWDPARNAYGWLRGELDRAYLPAELEAGHDSTTRFVFVQADAADGLREARWVDSLDWPRLAGIVAFAPVERTDVLHDYLSELRRIDRVVGVRRLLQDEPLDVFDSAALTTGLRAVAAAGLTFDACVRAHQLAPLIGLLDRVPELDVVLDHLGKPQIGEGVDEVWRRNLGILAENPRVHVKLSGLAPESDPRRPVLEQALPVVEAAVELFGDDRCMIGSDWPVSSSTPQRLPIGEWFGILDVLAERGHDRELLGSSTAIRFYGLDRSRATDGRAAPATGAAR